MRILVTGGAGFIGSHTAKALAAAGHEPVSYDNLRTGHRWAAKWGPLVERDLADADALRASIREHRIDAVIHFAASAYVGESMADPSGYFRNNLVNTLGLLDVMVEAGVKTIVFSSSCTTYGVPEHVPIGEDHPQSPASPYGESKLAVERTLRWYGQAYGIRWIALRYFNAAGADADGELGEDHNPETHLVPSAILAALGQRLPLAVFGGDYNTPDGTAVRDYVHVTDLADAHVRALGYLAEGGESGAVNLGTGRGYSVLEVIAAVEAVGGTPVPVIVSPRRDGDVPILVADPDRARQWLGWVAAQSDLCTIVRTAWDWHCSHAPGPATGQ